MKEYTALYEQRSQNFNPFLFTMIHLLKAGKSTPLFRVRFRKPVFKVYPLKIQALIQKC